MPIHDWTRVDAGVFHAFHHDWITEIGRALNQGVLPSAYYAMPEQIAGGLGPDVLTLQRPGQKDVSVTEPAGGLLLTDAPPKVQLRVRSEPDKYAAKAKSVVIRHSSDHRVVAVVEVVSPGNKNNRHAVRAFVEKALEFLRAGVHMVILDLQPPGPRDPQGIHKLIWDQIGDDEFVLPKGKPLTLASYLAGAFPEAFLEFAAVGSSMPEMPLFLTEEVYVRIPLEAPYQRAFEGMAEYWRRVLNQT